MATAVTCSVDEAEKWWIWSLRAELKWVDDVSQVRCTRCGQVMLVHYTGNCGHKFCQDCKENFCSRDSDFVCPHSECTQPVVNMCVKRDRAFDHKVSSLHAHCINRPYGCPVVDKLCNLVKHIKSCEIPSKCNSRYGMAMDELERLKMEKLNCGGRELDRETNEIRSESAENEDFKPDFRPHWVSLSTNERNVDLQNHFTERDRLIKERDHARDLYVTLLENVKWAEMRGTRVSFSALPTSFDESIQRRVAQREKMESLQTQVLQKDAEYTALQKQFCELALQVPKSSTPVEADEIRRLKVKLWVCEATLAAQDVECETLKGKLDLKGAKMDDLRAENEMLKEAAKRNREVRDQLQWEHREKMEGLLAKSDQIVAEVQGLQEQLKTTASGKSAPSMAASGGGAGYFLTRSEYEKISVHMQCASCGFAGHLERRCPLSPLMWEDGQAARSAEETDHEESEYDCIFCQSKQDEFDSSSSKAQ